MINNGGGRGRLLARRVVLTAAAAATLLPIAGAAFAAGPERSLAGISIFAPGSEVTRKFGNPSRILVGGVAPSAASAMTGAGGGPGGGMGGPGGGMGGPGGGSSGYPGSSGGSPSSLPGFGQQLGNQMSQMMGGSGSEFPGSPGSLPGGPGAPGGGPTAPPPKQPVTLIYDRQNGGSLEFTISPDKRVIQIRETGYSGAYGTSRSIKLGVSYAQVVARYGYPENTYIQGSVVSTDYKDTLHCGFQFLDQKLVGIIVASPD